MSHVYDQNVLTPSSGPLEEERREEALELRANFFDAFNDGGMSGEASHSRSLI